jgi:CHASE2 domain-containing sensor protein
LRERAIDLDHIGAEERFPWRIVLLVPALVILARAYWPALYLRVEDAALQIAAPMIPAGSPEASWTAPRPPQSRPSVLLIDDEAFEDRFKERSPLDRSELARLLEGIREQAPKLLVVDLDLSPGPAPTADEERAQAALDEVLKAYAPDQLLLATPLPARSYQLAQRRLHWMHGLCGAGVRFAHTTLLHSGSHVLRYDPTLPSLGPLAARMAGVQADDRIAEPEPCELVAEQMREIERGQAQALGRDSEQAGPRTLGAAYFLQAPASVAYYVDNQQARQLAPINFGYERFVRRHCLSSAAADDDCAQPADGAFKDQVVFLGGAWGQEDIHPTPLGRREGVMLHAAAFHSEQVPVSNRYRPLATAAEFVLGLIVAFVLGSVWSGYFRALYGQPQTLQRIAARYAYAGLATLLVLGVLWVIAQSSGWLMQHGVWLDPLPLLGVLLLKTLFTARKTELEAVRRPPAGEAHVAAPLTIYDKAARVVDALPRLAAHRLESLTQVVAALPAVHRHWDKVRRLWKKALTAGSILLLAWAVFILFAD